MKGDSKVSRMRNLENDGTIKIITGNQKNGLKYNERQMISVRTCSVSEISVI